MSVTAGRLRRSWAGGGAGGASVGRRCRPVLAVPGAVLVSVALLAGCGGARNALGTNANACFRALPEAKAAVGGKGQLVGVRRVSTVGLEQRLRRQPPLAETSAKELCVLAFHGNYRPGAVPRATNATQGKYAVVAVTVGQPVVVAVLLVDQLPTRFSHLR